MLARSWAAAIAFALATSPHHKDRAPPCQRWRVAFCKTRIPGNQRNKQRRQHNQISIYYIFIWREHSTFTFTHSGRCPASSGAIWRRFQYSDTGPGIELPRVPRETRHQGTRHQTHIRSHGCVLPLFQPQTTHLTLPSLSIARGM